MPEAGARKLRIDAVTSGNDTRHSVRGWLPAMLRSGRASNRMRSGVGRPAPQARPRTSSVLASASAYGPSLFPTNEWQLAELKWRVLFPATRFGAQE